MRVEENPSDEAAVHCTDSILSRMDMGNLTESQQQQLKEVVANYESTFSKDDEDIGYCDLVKHRVITMDRQTDKGST